MSELSMIKYASVVLILTHSAGRISWILPVMKLLLCPVCNSDHLKIHSQRGNSSRMPAFKHLVYMIKHLSKVNYTTRLTNPFEIVQLVCVIDSKAWPGVEIWSQEMGTKIFWSVVHPCLGHYPLLSPLPHKIKFSSASIILTFRKCHIWLGALHLELIILWHPYGSHCSVCATRRNQWGMASVQGWIFIIFSVFVSEISFITRPLNCTWGLQAANRLLFGAQQFSSRYHCSGGSDY